MRKDFGVKSYLYPAPVLMLGTYSEEGKADLMNAAWGGIYDSDKIMVSLSTDHKTVKNFEKTKALTISPAVKEVIKECDYLGLVSGNDVDKIAVVNFHPTKSEKVNAPLFKELPLTLECEVDSWNTETGILVAKIINVSIDEAILTDGKIDFDKFHLVSYDSMNHVYRLVHDVVGQAFKDGLTLKK